MRGLGTAADAVDQPRYLGHMGIPESDAVQVELDDGVGVITLNRPEAMNAWNGALCQGLDAALSWASETDDVRAVVITGAGRAFCAGADLSDGGSTFSEAADRGAGDDMAARTPTVLPWDVPKPVIAAINGHAVGVGATYSLSCDIRIIAETAKIGFVFARRGMLPELASHAVLSRVVGLSNAFDLLLSGRAINGIEASSMGLASRAAPAETVLDLALEQAKTLARLSAPIPMAISKRLMWDEIGVREMQAKEAPLFDWVAEQPDSVEGVASFLEKRDPAWLGSVADSLDAAPWPSGG